jgi:leucyl-tRNA synthetase
MKYDHKSVESKWQKQWFDNKVGDVENNAEGKENLYILHMFPYPSGDGLHLGHVFNFCGTDIYSRYKRMKGFNVMHPIGWDAFGLPAENFAIKTGIHPAEQTPKSIKTFTRQLMSVGNIYDWSREIDTSSPEYYKWTQWIFLFMYKHGLAYRKEAPVNWCESCKTILANEQAEGGICERCKNEVIQKNMNQWFFRITDFAEDLIKDLEILDWPESTKQAQLNWIGKSEGAEINFLVKETDKKITVFTTRPDTLFGATYMVLAPEHSLVSELKEKTENWDEVEKYIEQTKRKTEMDRTDLNKDKSGMILEGLKAVNPANGEEIPIFIADYVLVQYGTGAIMAVPAHDERDFEFAQKFNLKIKPVVSGGQEGQVYTGDGELINSREFNGLGVSEAKKRITEGVSGKLKTIYKLRDWSFGRQRYWGSPIPIIYCNSCGEVPVPEKDLPVMLPTDVDPKPMGKSPLVDSKSFHDVACPTCGKKAKRESDTMDTFVCSSWYQFRFADTKNEKEFASPESIESWLPVDLYVGGAEHTVLHLLYARFVTKALKKFGELSFIEPFIKMRHQGMILAEDGRKMSKSLGNVINPDEVVEVFGADTLRIYSMFMGPFKDTKPWSSQNIIGVRRFIERICRLSEKISDVTLDAETERMLHQSIKKVGEDLEDMRFNTAISSMMILLNHLEKLEEVDKVCFENFVKILSPLAPHICEELWHDLGHNSFIFRQKWPKYDPEKIVEDEVLVVIQINGKVRDEMRVKKGMEEGEIRQEAQNRAKVKEILEGQEIRKFIHVKDRLVNFVI